MYLSRLYQVTRIMNPDPRVLDIRAYNSETGYTADSTFHHLDRTRVELIPHCWQFCNGRCATVLLVIPTPQWAGKLRETWVGGWKRKRNGQEKEEEEGCPFSLALFPPFLLRLPYYRTEEGLPFLHRGALIFAKEQEKEDFCRSCVFLMGELMTCLVFPSGEANDHRSVKKKDKNTCYDIDHITASPLRTYHRCVSVNTFGNCL